MEGKITDRQPSRSRMFSPQEIRSIKTQLRIKRMSPEERRAYTERRIKERQRLDKMAEDRRTQPQRRRRQIRDAFRRMREERRRRRGLRGRTLEKPTRGTAPVRYRTRRQQERATGVRVPRRGRRGIIMEIDPVIFWNVVLTLIIAPAVWAFRNMMQEVKRIDILLNRTREDYASRAEVKDEMQHVWKHYID